jgi:hypothetical protein
MGACTEQSDVHTQPFAFRQSEEDDESVKMSNTTSGRSSALSPALPASRSCASDHATSIVILLALSEFSEGTALSDFCEGRPAPLLPASSACLPQAGISPALLCALCLPKPQFLFDTNEPLLNFATHTKQTTSFFLSHANECLSRASNFAIHTKQITSVQITSFFLFDTNERSPITTHQSRITNFLTR